MWVLLLPLPWFFLGLFAARLRRQGGPGCFIFVGVLGWPQAELLRAFGLTPAWAWAISLAVMVVCPVIGYWLGMRLFDGRTGRQESGDRGQNDGNGSAGPQ